MRVTLRALAFLLATALAWLMLFVGVGLVALATGGPEAIKDCQYEDVECRGIGEFLYDDTWPLLPVLLVVPALITGWLVTRRARSDG
jgi:hypothetical protein